MESKLKSISIIVPTYNSEKTISLCLQGIFDSISSHDEVIIVNDYSTDSTLDEVSRYKCKVLNFDHNRGPSSARNAGAKIAKNEILVFVDSDIVISKESLEDIRSYFEENHQVQSLTLNFEVDKRILNYSTRYKSHYMSYVTRSKNKSVNYIYGSYCAIQRKYFLIWPEGLRYAEDALWGYQQSKIGYDIHCLKAVKANHLKEYSLKSVIRNDFNIAFYFARNFLNESRWNTLVGNEEFGHTSKIQMLSVGLSLISFLFLGFSFNVSLFFITLWLLINSHFFYYILKHNNIIFFFKTIILYYVINLTYFAGIFTGVYLFLIEKIVIKKVKRTT